MAPRRQGLDAGDLKELFNIDPIDFKSAWYELKDRFFELIEDARPAITTVNFSHYLYYWWNKANINSLRRQHFFFLMLFKSSNCTRIQMFSGLTLMTCQYHSISQIISIGLRPSPPQLIGRTKHSHGLLLIRS